MGPHRVPSGVHFHGRAALAGRDLLLLRQPLPQAHQDLGHAALRAEAPVLQGLALRELPRRAPPLKGAARQPHPAAALRDPPRAVRGDCAVGKCALNATKRSGVKASMGKVKLFPSQNFDVKQPRDPVVCRGRLHERGGHEGPGRGDHPGAGGGRRERGDDGAGKRVPGLEGARSRRCTGRSCRATGTPRR